MTSTDENAPMKSTDENVASTSTDELINKPNDELKKDASTGTKDDVIKILLEHINTLQENIKNLEMRYTHVIFRYETISQNNHTMKAVTGITKETFTVIVQLLDLKDNLSAEGCLSAENQLFLFFVYLRSGISQIFLAYLFQIQQSTVSKICLKVSDVMYSLLKQISI